MIRKFKLVAHDYSISTWNLEKIRKDLDAGKDRRQEENGMTEDEMVGWHHLFNGHESEQALEDGEGQGSLVCCIPRGCKELDTTGKLNNNNYPFCTKQSSFSREYLIISLVVHFPSST